MNFKFRRKTTAEKINSSKHASTPETEKESRPSPSLSPSLKVFTREEFVEELRSRLTSPTDLGRMVSFVEKAFYLQNDIRRPVYVIEIPLNIAMEDVEYLQGTLQQAGVVALLVPPKLVTPVGELTKEGMGVHSVKEVLYSKLPLE